MAKKKQINPIREDMPLSKVMADVNKKFGERTMIFGSQKKKDPPRIPTGIFAVDFAIGGGLPLWRSICGWGPEAGGKTFLGIKAMRTASLLCWRCFRPKEYCKCSQKPLAMRSAWMAVEGCLDLSWVLACGVDPDSYVESTCDYGEQYLDVADAALRADDCGLLIFDSLGALLPEMEMEASASDQFMGKQAAMIGRAIRKLKTRMLMEMRRGKPCTVYFINQMRKKIGVSFGDPETMSGGHAMRHEFQLVLRMVKKSLSRGKDEKKGSDEHYIDTERSKEQASRHSFSIRNDKMLTLSGVGEFVIAKENMAGLDLTKGMVDDFNTMMHYAREYEVVVPDGKGWKYLTYKAPTHDAIKDVWKKKPSEYLRCEQEIIHRAKKRLDSVGGKNDN